MAKQYARGGFIELCRQFARIVDFLLLLVTLRIRGILVPFSELKRISFIELGPGPTRLAPLKRMLFREVYFVDKFDFGIPDSGLRLRDLEGCDDASVIVNDICGIRHRGPVFIFADHCIEHIPEVTVAKFLRSITAMGATACFRVPNVSSSVGKRNFGNDVTHKTSFDDALRTTIRECGFAVIPWLRWYRPSLLFSAALDANGIVNVAEEIAFCYGPGRERIQ